VNIIIITWHDALSGIPQGSILSQLLFIIYINDLPDVCNDLYTKLYIYADDTKLTTGDQQELQKDIYRLNDWANEWLLKLNAEKCCELTYTANLCNSSNTNYYIENCNTRYQLAKVDSIIDLGVKLRFDSKLAFWII